MNLPRVHISTFSFDLDAHDVSSGYTFVGTYITYSSIMLALPRFINRRNVVACVLTKHHDARHNVKRRERKLLEIYGDDERIKSGTNKK